MGMVDAHRLVTELEPILRGLEKLVNAPDHSAKLQPIQARGRGSDADIEVGNLKLRARYLSRSYSNAIEDAIPRLKNEAGELGSKVIPVLVVPYMGPSGQEICTRLKANWMDLAGNAQIMTEGVTIIVRGSPNKPSRRSGLGDLASPKGSRMVRRLLLEPDWRPTQRQLALRVDVTEAYASQFIGRMVRDGAVSKDDEGHIRVLDRNALLETWRDAYRVEKHTVLRGYMFSRSGVELMRQLSEKLRKMGVRHAMTGLAGAWLYDQFAAFRVLSLYVEKMPNEAVLHNIGFKADDKAANVWLIEPNDPGVFDGENVVDGIPVVHPLQVYLDLKGHAERAEEAAQHLRDNQFSWIAHG